MKTKYDYLIHSVDELRGLAVQFLESVPVHSIVCMDAEMGMGKTTFIQYVLHAMGIKDVKGSPTYSIVNEYVSPIYGKVYHLDLYRTETEEELYDIGLEEILYSDHFVFIEWASRAAALLPDEVIDLSITFEDDGARRFVWEV